MTNANSITADPSLDAFLAAIAQEESGGYKDPYSAHNPGGAIGKYQVMPGNVAAWTRRALGYSETPAQFQTDPAAQEAVARTILGGYFQQYGAAGAAAKWFSGQPNPNSGASDGTNSVRSYVAKVLGFMKNGTGTTTTPTTTPTTPTGVQPAGWDPTGVTGAVSGFAETIKNLALISPFVIGGVVLVVVGVAHATGADTKAKQAAGKAKQAGETAAMLAV